MATKGTIDVTGIGFSILRIVMGVSAGCLGIYLVIGLMIMLRQPSYVYYPDRIVGLTPSYFDIAFESLSLRTDDGEMIAGWYIPGKEGAPLAGKSLLFCHGNGGNIGGRLDSIRTFYKMGLDVLLFDYRGYGDSTGTPTEDGTYRDAAAAWENLLARGRAAEDIVVFGRSLGGAVALWVGANKHPGAVVVESAFTSAPDMAARMFPFLPVRRFCLFKYESLEYISQLSCPVLVAHGINDQTVPFEHGKRLFEAAREPKRFVTMAGDHNAGGLDANSEYQEIFVNYLLEHMRPTTLNAKRQGI